MTETPSQHAAVSLSRPFAGETPRHLPSCRDRTEASGQTADLKVLARLVLARDTCQDGNRDRVSHSGTENGSSARQSVSVSHRVKDSETVGETPAVLTGSIIQENQSSTGVSLSRLLGSETPETRQRLPCSEPAAQLPLAWDEVKDERSGIVEYDGGIPRAWAEGFARLHPDHPPGDVPVKRWLQFVDDIGLFLDSGWAEQAAALGWGPYDLFGCDRDRPFPCIDRAGLLWLLNGDRLLALTENTATVETRAGERQTYRRKLSGPGRVLAWELVP